MISVRLYSLRTSEAEGRGFEPPTHFWAPDFESGCWPIRLPSSARFLNLAAPPLVGNDDASRTWFWPNCGLFLKQHAPYSAAAADWPLRVRVALFLRLAPSGNICQGVAIRGGSQAPAGIIGRGRRAVRRFAPATHAGDSSSGFAQDAWCALARQNVRHCFHLRSIAGVS